MELLVTLLLSNQLLLPTSKYLFKKLFGKKLWHYECTAINVSHY